MHRHPAHVLELPSNQTRLGQYFVLFYGWGAAYNR
jgi:hypothetical protein